MSILRYPLYFLLAIGLLTVPARAELEVFGSFEDAAEISAVRASAGVRVTGSSRFPAWEGRSLEVVFPEGGGSLETSRIPPDWRSQESFLMFVWSEQPAELILGLRDAHGADFTRPFNLRPGVNHLQVKLDQLGKLDRERMQSVSLKTAGKGTFYVDYLALDRFHPVLEKRSRWDINYSLDVVTPHLDWARPLQGGPIRVYAIADVADGRGIVELAERLDLDFKATTIGASPGINKWGFGDFYEQRSGGGEFWAHAYSLAYAYIADDLIYGPRYDVILWPALRPWDSYPEELRQALRRRVEEGAGLILFQHGRRESGGWDPSPLVCEPLPGGREGTEGVGLNRSRWQPTEPHYITRGIAWDAFPWGFIGVPKTTASPDSRILLKTTDGAPVLAVKSVGKGRVVAFGYDEKGMIPAITKVFETGLDYPYHEYLWALVARAVVWAAGREPAAHIDAVSASSREVKVTLTSAPAGSNVRARVSTAFGEIEADELIVPVTAANQVEIKLPRRGAGRRFIDLRLMKGDRVLDWAAAVSDAPTPVSVSLLTTELDRVAVGQPVAVRVELSSTSATNCTVQARLYDNYDRLLDEQSVELSVSGKVDHRFALKTAGALTHLAHIDCEVSVDGARSDRRKADVFVLQPRSWDDFDIVMYRFGPDPIPGIWPAIDRQMRRLNVTTLSSYSLSHSKHANYNVQAQTRISGQESPDGPARDYYSKMKKRYLETGDKRGLVREHVLDDPAYRDLITRELKQKTEDWVPFSPMSYYVYEEPSLTCYGDAVDICFSPHTLNAMREWLRSTYGTLQSLNRQWGTEFAEWQSVIPDDAREAQARGNYSSWADHRTYMEKSYADTFSFVLDQLRKIDPEGILLNSGTQISGSHNGCDYSRINRYTRHLNAYDGGNQLDFHRCFNPDVKISGGAGYGVLGKDVFYNFYSNLFKGANGGAYIFWQYSTLDPDLTMSQSGKDMEEGFRELRAEGIGKLVGLATPENNAIAIHYSYQSIHGAWIVDGAMKEEVSYNTSKSFDRFNENRDGWVKILKDSGLQFDFLAYSGVERGELTSKGYKVFVLPMSFALSDKEITAIRDFVAGGGVLLADALAGVMDEHCRFRSNRGLLEVFGIEAAPGTRQAVMEGTGEQGLSLKGARVLEQAGDTPVVLAHKFGKGQAFLLNYHLDGYPRDKVEKRSTPALARFSKVLREARIIPGIRLTNAAGQRVSDCSTYVFNTGKTRLVGLVPDMKKASPEKLSIAFDGPADVYDVRGKKYLGRLDRFETTVEPGVPRLFALVPRPITRLDVALPPGVRLGEEIQVRCDSGIGDFRSVARVQVFNPEGQEISYYGGNRDIANGAGTARFRTALNDPPGRWKVIITEVISGARAVGEVDVVALQGRAHEAEGVE